MPRYSIHGAGWLFWLKEFFPMCDYSLHSVRSRPAKIGDKLITRDFGTGTRGFAPVTERRVAVCVLPGTELAFASEVRYANWSIRAFLTRRRVKLPRKTAIFRQINHGFTA